LSLAALLWGCHGEEPSTSNTSPAHGDYRVGDPVDLDGDGIFDGWAVDTDGDGAADAVDTDGDGLGDRPLPGHSWGGDGDGDEPLTPVGGGDGDVAPLPRGGDDDGDGSCASIKKEAEITRGPVDIVWVVDSSLSMSDEFLNVAANLGAFADNLEKSGANARVVMMHAFSQLLDPVTSTPLGQDKDRYRYLWTNVDSWNSLRVLLNEYDRYKDFLRPSAPKHFIVVSDDESNPLLGGMLARDFKSAMEGKLGSEFFFHAVVADGKSACFGASVGAQYIELASQTGGLTMPICTSDWSALFAKLTSAVIESAPLPCDFEIPPPPDGDMLDPDAVQVVFTAAHGSEAEFPRASGADKCGSSTGWYYDDADAPTRIEFCPAACAQVKKGGAVGIAFGCAPTVIF
jgi:hypothetical protein